jgi:hypothetical protein
METLGDFTLAESIAKYLTSSSRATEARLAESVEKVSPFSLHGWRAVLEEDEASYRYPFTRARNAYFGNRHHGMNGLLREFPFSSRSKSETVTEDFLADRVLATLLSVSPKTPIDMKLYRGIRFGNSAAFRKAFVVGREIAVREFMSTTRSLEVAKGFASRGSTKVVLVLSVPKGTRLHVRGIGLVGESEILLGPCKIWMVDRVEETTTEPRFFVVHMRLREAGIYDFGDGVSVTDVDNPEFVARAARYAIQYLSFDLRYDMEGEDRLPESIQRLQAATVEAAEKESARFLEKGGECAEFHPITDDGTASPLQELIAREPPSAVPPVEVSMTEGTVEYPSVPSLPEEIVKYPSLPSLTEEVSIHSIAIPKDAIVEALDRGHPADVQQIANSYTVPEYRAILQLPRATGKLAIQAAPASHPIERLALASPTVIRQLPIVTLDVPRAAPKTRPLAPVVSSLGERKSPARRSPARKQPRCCTRCVAIAESTGRRCKRRSSCRKYRSKLCASHQRKRRTPRIS